MLLRDIDPSRIKHLGTVGEPAHDGTPPQAGSKPTKHSHGRTSKSRQRSLHCHDGANVHGAKRLRSTARFRFYGALGPLLAPAYRGQRFVFAVARAATLKNAIEALGVPHTEVARILVNGEPATLSRIVRDGDEVEVFPWEDGACAVPAEEPRFLADVHLGGLARFLRMLGFDTRHAPDLQDADIRRLAHDERRVVLTRDRELLKSRDIDAGCFVRTLRPEAQLCEVAARYALAAAARPFTRCLRCNLLLTPVEKQTVAHRLPAQVREGQAHFTYCGGCDRVYWPGTHYARMQAVLRELLPAMPPQEPDQALT